MNRLLLWFTTAVFGAAIGLGTASFPFLLVAALAVVTLVAVSDAKRVGLSGFLLGFGGIWFLMISRTRELCARGELSGCYSSVDNAWFNAAAGSLIVAVVLVAWVAGLTPCEPASGQARAPVAIRPPASSHGTRITTYPPAVTHKSPQAA